MEGGGFLGHPLVMPYENQQPSTNMNAICLLSRPHSDNPVIILESSDDGYPSLLVLVFEPVKDGAGVEVSRDKTGLFADASLVDDAEQVGCHSGGQTFLAEVIKYKEIATD